MTPKDTAEMLLKKYFDWLKNKTSLDAIQNGWVEITTPYLDRHNDYLQIYFKKEGDHFILTDDGYIIDDLILSGWDLATPHRKELLTTILANFGIHLINHNELTVQAFNDDFPSKKHNLIQAMLAVNNLFYVSRSQNKD